MVVLQKVIITAVAIVTAPFTAAQESKHKLLYFSLKAYPPAASSTDGLGFVSNFHTKIEVQACLLLVFTHSNTCHLQTLTHFWARTST